jgi:hypothetical protein
VNEPTYYHGWNGDYLVVPAPIQDVLDNKAYSSQWKTVDKTMGAKRISSAGSGQQSFDLWAKHFLPVN